MANHLLTWRIEHPSMDHPGRSAQPAVSLLRDVFSGAKWGQLVHWKVPRDPLGLVRVGTPLSIGTPGTPNEIPQPQSHVYLTFNRNQEAE